MRKQIFFIVVLAVVGLSANAQYGSYDSVSFENPTNKIVIDTTGGNLWQIGVPQKAFFSNAHSGTKAILTDTINSYPSNDTSSFIYIIRNPYTQTCQTCMEFWHKYDMDTIGDKGLIDASYDGGNSWIPVKDTSIYLPLMSLFIWDWDFHESNSGYTYHKPVITGKSDGWIKSNFCWQWWMPVKKDTIITNPDSLIIRFTFISDSITKNKEGWMIDDIVTSSAGGNICSGIDEVSLRDKISLYPNPATTTLTIETPQQSSITITNIQGQLIKTLATSGTNTNVDISGFAKGLYFLKVQSEEGVAVKRFVKE